MTMDTALPRYTSASAGSKRDSAAARSTRRDPRTEPAPVRWLIIGLAVAFWAKRRGAAKVAIQDIAEFQKSRALEMGADVFVVDPADPAGSAERALGGKADIVFECVGLPGLIAQGVEQVRPRGTILLLGLCTRPDTFNSFAMLSKEVRLVTSAFFTVPEYRASLDALAEGAIEPRLLVTDTVSLSDTPEVFESLKRRTSQCKVLIAP